jgi:hypothetical protein
MVRFIITGFFVLAGLSLAVLSLFNGQPVVALTLTLSAIYAGFAVVFGIVDSISNPIFKLTAGVISLLGVLGIFLYNRAFDLNIQKAHYDVLSDIVHMESYCKPMSQELHKIQEFGLKACAIQGSADQSSATAELAKGFYLGPTLSIVDSAVSLHNGSEPDYCAEAYKVAFTLCPSAFISLSRTSKNALNDKAK